MCCQENTTRSVAATRLPTVMQVHGVPVALVRCSGFCVASAASRETVWRGSRAVLRYLVLGLDTV